MSKGHIMSTEDTGLDGLISAMKRLSPASQELVEPLVRKLAEREGIAIEATKPPQVVSIADGIELWVTKLRGERRSHKTVKMYRYLAEKFLEQNPEPTRADIRKYIDQRLNDGLSPAAVENERKALRSLFSFLKKEGLRHDDPTEGIRHIKVPYNEKRCPSVDDVERVLNEGCLRSNDTEKIRMLIRLIATTGLRLSEAAGLKKEDIDFTSNELRVMGKGRKLRMVPLLPGVSTAIREYIDRRPSESLFIFPGNTKTGYAEIYNIEKTLKRACKRASVEPFTPHQLRHLYATEMLRKGAKLEVVGRILGHSSIGITADIYRHVRTGEMHEEARRFAPMNGG